MFELIRSYIVIMSAWALVRSLNVDILTFPAPLYCFNGTQMTSMETVWDLKPLKHDASCVYVSPSNDEKYGYWNASKTFAENIAMHVAQYGGDVTVFDHRECNERLSDAYLLFLFVDADTKDEQYLQSRWYRTFDKVMSRKERKEEL